LFSLFFLSPLFVGIKVTFSCHTASAQTQGQNAEL
jgi:hypothetical protein